MNEIANFPSRFVSTNPYLVVPSDLIRPRYLPVTGTGVGAQNYLPAAVASTVIDTFQVPNFDPKINVDVISQQLSRGIGQGRLPGDDDPDLTQEYLAGFYYQKQDRNLGIGSLRPPTLKKSLINLLKGKKKP